MWTRNLARCAALVSAALFTMAGCEKASAPTGLEEGGQLPAASIDVVPSSATIPQGKTIRLRAIVKDAEGQELSGGLMTWSSSQADVATVSSDGLVRGMSAGTAEITAAIQGLRGSAQLRVVPDQGRRDQPDQPEIR